MKPEFYKIGVEIGLAYGISAGVICSAASQEIVIIGILLSIPTKDVIMVMQDLRRLNLVDIIKSN